MSSKGAVDGALVQIGLQLYYSAKALEAYSAEQPRQQALADENMSLAEEVFAKHKDLIKKSDRLYDEAENFKTLPRCDMNTMGAKRADAMRAAYQAFDQRMDNMDCYSEGHIRHVMRRTSKIAQAATMQAYVDARIYEDALEDAQNAQKTGALTDMADRVSGYGTVASGFGSAAQGLIGIYNSEQNRLAGEAALVSYGIGTAYSYGRNALVRGAQTLVNSSFIQNIGGPQVGPGSQAFNNVTAPTSIEQLGVDVRTLPSDTAFNPLL